MAGGCPAFNHESHGKCPVLNQTSSSGCPGMFYLVLKLQLLITLNVLTEEWQVVALCLTMKATIKERPPLLDVVQVSFIGDSQV
jgi:hypothetical protein